MSTVAYVRAKVDMRLRQQDSKNRSYSVPEVDYAIREKFASRSASLPPARVAESAAFSISGGGDTFTVTLSGTTYSDGDEVRIQLASTGNFLQKTTVEGIDAMRDGAPNVFLGVPDWFALWTDHQGVLRGRCYPGALATQSCNLFRSRSPAPVFSSTDLDSQAIYWPEPACVALAAEVAADLLLALPDSELEKRRLSRETAALWKKEAEVLFYQEAGRRDDLESTGIGTHRWVS